MTEQLELKCEVDVRCHHFRREIGAWYNHLLKFRPPNVHIEIRQIGENGLRVGVVGFDGDINEMDRYAIKELYALLRVHGYHDSSGKVRDENAFADIFGTKGAIVYLNRKYADVSVEGPEDIVS